MTTPRSAPGPGLCWPRTAVILTSSRDASAYAADLARTGLPFIAKEDLSGPAIRAMLGGRG